ncbi:MAG: carbamoyl-phosphate synthase large subunit [Thermoguttaceae bacterium]|nr:carbamoyl-phosphate synthase large subunit [Thermoguttaceae bacterium]
MPKRQDLRKILVIGSGPIVIGQAAEFDYAGTQAALALKEEGYQVVLCNSNPATIMTDTAIADKVYMEPLTPEFVAKIVRCERPDAILPSLGGQVGLNIAVQLEKSGVLDECQTELIGAKSKSIERAEDRKLFKELCESLGEPTLPSDVANSIEEGVKIAERIGYPIVVRPAFTLGGTGGGFAQNEEEFRVLMKRALALSPARQALVEKSVKGYKEIEYEVMRDSNDAALAICNMENVDPVGVHTGDSVVVCPSQTLTNKEYHMLRDAALRIVRALEIEGGCNVQFALDPKSFQYYVIEVNPRVSRSSALASKASGYPIARVSAKIAVGLRLDEIQLASAPAAFEPALDYVVTKIARFPFDKFADADSSLGTQMKATGEIMSVGRTFEESLLKGVRSLETRHFHLWDAKFDDLSESELLAYVAKGTDDRLYAVAKLLRLGTPVERIVEATQIDKFFIDKIKNIVDEEREVRDNPGNPDVLREAKRLGFSDKAIAKLWNQTELDVRKFRVASGVLPTYKMIDSCASEFDSYVPYYYSTYESENESAPSDKPKIVVLGSGPIRIGQGVEFDYSTVCAVKTIKAAGYEAIIINDNPETVSTDYTCSDKLYFEPLTVEDVMNVVELERPSGVIATLGGQTAINLAEPLSDLGVKLIGTDRDAIDRAENRDLFEQLLSELQIPRPKGRAVTSVEEGAKTAAEIGYPVLVRPSFVLGGRAMRIVGNEGDLREYFRTTVEISDDKPVLVDKYVKGKEVELDAVCDGERVFVPGVMELVERAGVHSGDSISVYPSYSVSPIVKEIVLDYARRLGLALGIKGLFNIQFIVDENDKVYVIEVNPRSSRTVPFLSKATGYRLADIATRVMLGHSLKEQGFDVLYPKEKERYYVKVPVFSFSKLTGADSYLSPEMKSTGEAIGYDKKLHRAMYKALIAGGIKMRDYGTVLVSLADEDKAEGAPLVRRFHRMGFEIEATEGTAKFLEEKGIPATVMSKISDGSDDIPKAIRSGRVSCVVNTRPTLSGSHDDDGLAIRLCATQNNVTLLSSLDTTKALLDALEELALRVSTIDEE